MSLSNTQKTWRGTANGPSGVVLGSPWIPFALPGQIVLGSEAVTGTSTTTVRPSIALNGWRSYDPLFGAFLQPDTNDQSGTSWPEQYFLALNNPVAFQDRIGNSSQLEDAVRSGLSIALELLDLYDYSRNLIFAGNCAKHELILLLFPFSFCLPCQNRR